MFDEQDRHLRLRLNSSRDVEVDSTPAPRSGLPFLSKEDTPAPVPNTSMPDNNSPPTTPPPESGGRPDTVPLTTRASDRRPQVVPIRAQQLATGDFDDLASLEAEAKRLESLARELDSRASALERQVRELE
jgi:hypothetical protein